MRRFALQSIVSQAAELAEASGVRAGDARVLAEALADADLHGVATHGMSRLGIYLQRIEKGVIDARAELRLERNGGSILVLDAGNGLGQVQAMKALDLLRARAEKNGIAAATIRNSQHFGALSYYCGLMADAGMILLAMTNGEPAMAPAGGYEAFFGTNPIAASFPTGLGFNVKIDMATSVVARGNIIAANRKKSDIPEGWALDREGNATTDAQAALLGSVLTMAGHKGYALAFLIEAFAGVLSGAAVGSEVGSMYKHLERKQDVGHFFCLLNIESFMEVSSFRQRMDAMVAELKGGKRRPGVEEILVPGERSARVARTNRAAGVPLTDETVTEIEQLCARLAVPFALDEVRG